MKTRNPPTLAEARANLQKAWELQNSHMSLEEWRRVVRPDVAEWAVKVHGSLEAAYNDFRISVCTVFLLAYAQWEAAEERRKNRMKTGGRK